MILKKNKKAIFFLFYQCFAIVWISEFIKSFGIDFLTFYFELRIHSFILMQKYW